MIRLPDADDYDAAVDAMDGIDRWCTSSDWVLPLTASMGARDPFIVRSGSGWGLFDRVIDPTGNPVLVGVDRVWGFASAVVGPPDAWVEVAQALADEPWGLCLLPGLVEQRDAWRAAVTAFGRHHELYRAGDITRQRADLHDGFDAWFARRTPRFRQRLRRVRRDAERAGIELEALDPTAEPAVVLGRLIAVESSSWKGRRRDGLCSADFARFYELVLERLRAGARMRALVARLDGEDVGYILGGVRAATYRGLQLSYSDRVADLSVGHLLQLEQLERLVAEGVTTYDLGMDIDYKRRWADEALATTVIAVRRSE